LNPSSVTPWKVLRKAALVVQAKMSVNAGVMAREVLDRVVIPSFDEENTLVLSDYHGGRLFVAIIASGERATPDLVSFVVDVLSEVVMEDVV
jgi:hypothetical protein